MKLMQPLILLDTNIVLYFLGRKLVNPLPSGNYFISVITEMELLSYLTLSSDEEKRIIGFLNKITVVGIDENITISLRKQYKLKLADAIIVATAQSLSATLLTNDIKLTNLTNINTQSLQIYS